MADTVIQVENLGKQYRIGERGHAVFPTLRDQIARSLRAALTRTRTPAPADGERNHRPGKQEFWALRDVSFDVRRGDVVGVIGRNGAGKSTLLKILSRITEPTTGCADIRGRVGSLLEVGTGFHMELTGRENVYLNGAILGMKRREISQRFDEIVEFADVSRFVDTPVKHYSTGMHLRLAFAVAAHLQPEILIVDEVLAVGDVDFQRKCINKMQDVAHQGRTVLFVSHNMQAVVRLCNRAIELAQGVVLREGPVHKVVSEYLRGGSGPSGSREWPSDNAPGSDVVRLCRVSVRGEDQELLQVSDIRKPMFLEMEYEVLRAGCVVLAHFSVHNEYGIQVFSAVDNGPTWRGSPRPVGRYVTTGRIPGNLLTEGTLIVGAAVNTLQPSVLQFHAQEAVSVRIVDDAEGDSARGDFPGTLNGVVMPLLQWETRLLCGDAVNSTH